MTNRTPEQYLEHFNGKRAEMAKAAVVTTQAVGRWFKRGVVPPRSAVLLDQAIEARSRSTAALQ